MPERIRQIVLAAAGIAALVFALWPPGVDFPYLGVAAALLGIEPLAGGLQQAKLREPSPEDQQALAHWMESRDKVRGK